MLAKILSGGVIGVDPYLVDVEVDVANGLQSMDLVGLPEAAVKEARVRVKAALDNCGYQFPRKRVTVNLAPADVRKAGSAYDLPVAVGVLTAMGVIPREAVKDSIFYGELSLNGSIKPASGVLPVAIGARDAGISTVVVGSHNAQEAAAVTGVEVLPATNLVDLVEHLSGRMAMPLFSHDEGAVPTLEATVDMAEIKGQEHARRALEVAAAGGHNILMVGPPGSGKTMLARRLPTILAPMSLDESLETTKIYSVKGLLRGFGGLLRQRPFRSPHHTISEVALAGGGTNPLPGEVSLAHHGVLFLDEVGEFKRNALEVLRQPMEDGFVTVARAAHTVTYPASFMLVAAMNPCPCGHLDDPRRNCSCTAHELKRYRAKLSGPLLDRIDIQIHVPAVELSEIAKERRGEPSAVIRERVAQALGRQRARLDGEGIHRNAQMEVRHISRHCKPAPKARELLERSIERLGLSARAYHRVLKVARTIADLEGEETIGIPHVAEAISYRFLDRQME